MGTRRRRSCCRCSFGRLALSFQQGQKSFWINTNLLLLLPPLVSQSPCSPPRGWSLFRASAIVNWKASTGWSCLFLNIRQVRSSSVTWSVPVVSFLGQRLFLCRPWAVPFHLLGTFSFFLCLSDPLVPWVMESWPAMGLVMAPLITPHTSSCVLGVFPRVPQSAHPGSARKLPSWQARSQCQISPGWQCLNPPYLLAHRQALFFT